MIHWRQAVQQFGCTRCGAAPGEKCRTDSGSPRYEPHVDRSNLAAEHGWELLAGELPSSPEPSRPDLSRR